MGSDYRKHNSLTGQERRLFYNDCGDAVVEAALMFPIMTMIFAALVLAAIYLPSQAMLQRATQQAATALATEISDTWLFFDESSMSYYRENDKSRLTNVYAALFEKNEAYIGSKGESITSNAESRSISSKAGELEVSCYVDNKIVYKEIIVEATREYPMPVDLSFIGFPRTIAVAASAAAAVQDGDEFVRNIDMATDFAQFITERFGLSDVKDSIGKFGGQVRSLMGW